MSEETMEEFLNNMPSLRYLAMKEEIEQEGVANWAMKVVDEMALAFLPEANEAQAVLEGTKEHTEIIAYTAAVSAASGILVQASMEMPEALADVFIEQAGNVLVMLARIALWTGYKLGRDSK